MVLWLRRCGLDWFCPGVPGFGQWLDSTGTQALSPFNFSLAVLLFWFQRILHAGAGPALEQAGFFPIRPVGRFTTIGRSETRTLRPQPAIRFSRKKRSHECE